MKIFLVLLMLLCLVGCQEKKKKNNLCDPRLAMVGSCSRAAPPIVPIPGKPDPIDKDLFPPVIEPHPRSVEEMQDEIADENDLRPPPPCEPDDPRYEDKDNWT